MRIFRFVSLVIVCLALFAFGISSPAKAETNMPLVDAVVQDCTEAKFDQALAIVQASAGGTITFIQSCPAIVFTSEKYITKHVTIDGGNKTTLSGGNATRHFSLNQHSRLTLKNIILAQGYAVSSTGGSIWLGFSAVLITDNVIFELNQADQMGSAIYGEGDAAITLNTTTVQSNTADSNTAGYGAISSSGSLTITNSLLQGNRVARKGAAINAGGKVLIQNTILSGNIALQEGSAIYYHGDAGLTLSNSTVSNHANIAIWNETRMTIIGSNISDNHAGLYTQLNDPLAQDGAATLINTTLSNNQYGIELGPYGSASLQYVTLFGSRVNGVYMPYSTSSLSMTNVVIQKPANAEVFSSNCNFLSPKAVITSNGYNLSSDFSCASYLINTGDRNNVASGLALLADNGGPTLTHLPQAGSPLIDGGACTNGINTDQRGFARPSGTACDIGAVEVHPPQPITIVPRARIPIVVK